MSEPTIPAAIGQSLKTGPVVAGAAVTALTLNEWVGIATLSYIVIQALILVRKWWREEREDRLRNMWREDLADRKSELEAKWQRKLDEEVVEHGVE